MKVSWNFIVRILGMGALAYFGNFLGTTLSGSPPRENEVMATQLLTLAGAGLGLLVTPRFTLEPLAEALRYVKSVSISELIAIVFGALVGVVFATLVSFPLSRLPGWLGQFSPLLAAIVFAYVGGMIFSMRKKDIGNMLRSSRRSPFVLPQQLMENLPKNTRRYLLDTSAIIDGRVAAVNETGFLDGEILVPHFVLAELQVLADSADEQRRTKGRRGLEILNTMQKEGDSPVEIVDVEISGLQQVDDKLVVLARQYQCPIITNDFNLGRVAALQGVKVLNFNQLADAVRPPVMPGQDIYITIRDVGREREQGISFLDDGTMIVVEDARKLVGQSVSVTVTRVFQTQTGRIVFAHLNSNERSF
jgi:uncharacterized protein YacL